MTSLPFYHSVTLIPLPSLSPGPVGHTSLQDPIQPSVNGRAGIRSAGSYSTWKVLLFGGHRLTLTYSRETSSLGDSLRPLLHFPIHSPHVAAPRISAEERPTSLQRFPGNNHGQTDATEMVFFGARASVDRPSSRRGAADRSTRPIIFGLSQGPRTT